MIKKGEEEVPSTKKEQEGWNTNFQDKFNETIGENMALKDENLRLKDANKLLLRNL